MEELEAIRINEAIRILNSSLKYLDILDSEQVNEIISKYQKKIINYNHQHTTIINPTAREMGEVSLSLKKRVSAFYVNPIIKELRQKEKSLEVLDDEGYITDESYEKMREVSSEINKLYRLSGDFCDKTVLSKEIINAKIKLKRRVKNWYEMDHLEKELNEFILTQMLIQFQEQNQEFINKINNYDTCKQ